VTALRQPGWYAEPGGAPDQLRWWDGSDWSGISRARMEHEPAPALPPQPRPLPPAPGGGVLLPAGELIGGAPGSGAGPSYVGPAGPAWSGGETLDTEPPPRPRWTWPVVTGIVVIIGVLVATGVLPGMDTGTKQPTPPAAQVLPAPPLDRRASPDFDPPTSDAPPVPVSGRIVDQVARLSYDVLPGGWLSWSKTPFTGMLSSSGYYRVLQRNTPQGGEYWANVNSGVLNPAIAGRSPMSAMADRLVASLDQAYYPPHTQRDLKRTAITVDGHPAYLISYLAVFDPKRAAGYTARSEQVLVLLIDTGRELPSVLYVSIPDTAKDSWPRLPALVASVRTLP
jgi:Protein of unknown function (DUF2510)